MRNFDYYNPVKILFGKGKIAEIAKWIPKGMKVMMTYGGGSIKKNGVYEQVMDALQGFDIVEFGGIEPNPKYETLMRAVELAKQENVGFLLAVGGGSVIDGTKFIAAATCFEGNEPWDIVAKGARVNAALPLGAVLTLPATGSEMNSGGGDHSPVYFGKTGIQFSSRVPEILCTGPDGDLFITYETSG